MTRLLHSHEVEYIRKHNRQIHSSVIHTWKLPDAGRYWVYEKIDGLYMQRDEMRGKRLLEGIQRTYLLS